MVNLGVQGSCCGCAHGKQDRIAGSSCRTSSWACKIICINFQISFCDILCAMLGQTCANILGLLAKTAFKCFGQTWGKAAHEDDIQLTKPKLQSVWWESSKKIYQMNPNEIISCRSRTNGTYFISLMGQPGKCFFHVTIMVPPRYSTVGWRQLVVNKTLTRPRWIGDLRKIQPLLRSSSMDWNPTKRMPKRYYLREMKRATWCLHVTNLFGGWYK